MQVELPSEIDLLDHYNHELQKEMQVPSKVMQCYFTHQELSEQWGHCIAQVSAIDLAQSRGSLRSAETIDERQEHQ